MRRAPGWLERLVARGEYQIALEQSRSEQELASLLGVSMDTLRGARNRMRNRGQFVQSVAEFLESGGRVSRPVDVDMSEFEAEEATHPERDVLLSPATGSTERDVRVVQETITQVEEHRLRKRVRDLEAENRKLIEQLSDGGEYHELVSDVLARQAESPPPRIAPRERTSGLREGTPLILASDWHLEEEVRPEQVAGRNRYNLEISAQRMERFFEASLAMIRHQREVYKIRDCIPWWGGDFITNFLHEENPQSNLLSPTDAILFAQTNMIAGIDHWLDDPEIEQFTFLCNDGNHGRLTDEMHYATRTQNSLEVFLYAQLALHYRNEPRIRFILPTSQFTFLDDVYGRTIRATHLDSIRYSGGVGGITIPLFKAMAKWETVKRADLTIGGHFHQRYCLPNLMVNGSLIGFNSYAMGIGAPFEHPVQSMRMLDAHRWTGPDIPLFVSDRRDDDMASAA